MRRVLIAVAVALLGAAGLGWPQNAQTPAPAPGFSVERTLLELSQFLPPAGPRPERGGGGGGQPARPRGQHGQGQGFAGQAAPRDPALFFSADQVDRLLPLLQGLRESPYPTPAAGKKLSAAIDGLLTSAQKAAREKKREERQKALANLPADARQRLQERQQGGQQGGQPGAPQRDPLQRRQRLIDNFIGMLEDRKRELAGG